MTPSPIQMRVASEEHERSLTRKINFTRTVLAKIVVPAGKDRISIFDSHTPNLAFVKMSSGSSRFYWVGKLDGRPVRHPLGDGGMAVEQARKLAIARSTDRANGINFHEQKKQARGEMTLRELFDWYLENHAKPTKRTWREDEQKFKLHLQGLASRKVSSITRQDVATLHRKIGQTSPGSANRLVALVSSIFGRAGALGVNVENPAKGIQRFPEHQRERFLLPDEMTRFMQAVADEPAPWNDFFLVCLFTGARRNNVLTMRWDEIDLDAKVWRIPGSKFKNGQNQTVHLADNVVALLRSRAGNKSEWAFPSYGTSGHIRSPRQAWERITERAGLSGLWIHDLRRSLGSWMAGSGSNQSVIGKTLGHLSPSITARYTRVSLDPVRVGVDTAVNAMLEAAKPKVPETAK